MMTNDHSRLNKHAVAYLATLSFAAAALTATAQQSVPAPTVVAAPAPEAAFSYELGRATADGDGGAGSTYTVASTVEYSSKQTGAKLRLMVVEKGGAGTMTHLLTVNTGKYKTVAQLTETLAGIFRKYLADAPANQEIGKIGDINHGGEIRFVAESREKLRYDWQAPGEPTHSTQFKRNDIQVFLGILMHPKVGR